MKNLENLKIIFDDYKLDIEDIIDIENLMCVSQVSDSKICKEYHIEYCNGNNCHVVKYLYKDTTYSAVSDSFEELEVSKEEFDLIKNLKMGFMVIENFNSDNIKDNGYNGVCTYSMNRCNIGNSKHLYKKYYDKGVDITTQSEIIKNRMCIFNQEINIGGC